METRIEGRLFAKVHSEYEYIVFKRGISHPALYSHFRKPDKMLPVSAHLGKCLQQLYALLQPLNIHLNSGIFEDYLLSILSLNEGPLTSEKVKNCVPFGRVKTKASPTWRMSLETLFYYFDVSITKYENQSLGSVVLQDKECIDDIASHFKPWLDKLPAHAIDQYQLASLYSLKYTTWRNAHFLAKDLARILNEKGSDLDENQKKLFPLIAQINGVISISDDETPNDYLSLLSKKLHEQISQLKVNPEYSWLLAHLENYLRQKNKYLEVHKIQDNLFEEVNQFLLPYKISHYECPVIVETLLLSAGVEIPDNLGCIWHKKSVELGRLELQFNNLSKEATEQLKNFLYLHDDTAEYHESSYQSHWFHKDPGFPEMESPIKTLSISVNPVAFYNKIFPILQKKFIERLNNNDAKIEVYKEASLNAFMTSPRYQSSLFNLFKSSDSGSEAESSASEIESDQEVYYDDGSVARYNHRRVNE